MPPQQKKFEVVDDPKYQIVDDPAYQQPQAPKADPLGNFVKTLFFNRFPGSETAADLLTGGVKQAGRILTSPARLLGADPIEQFQPQGNTQQFGANLGEAASYLIPIAGEERLASAAGSQLLKLARPLRSLLGRGGTRAAITGGNVAARAAIGGASGAITAGANEQDPFTAALMGAGVPTALKVAAPVLKKGATALHESARTSMARAIQPGNTVSKFISQKILDPLLQMRAHWWTSKGLKNISQAKIAEAAKTREAERALLGQDPMMMYDDVEKALNAGRDAAFLRGRMGNGMPMANNPAESAGYSAFEKFKGDYIDPKTSIGPTGDRMIPFDQLDLTKRVAQDYAAKHGKAFLDLPRDPITSAEAWAEEVASNAIRPQLENFAGMKWADQNKIMHTWLAIKELAMDRMGKQLGQKVPLAERTLFGFGWDLGGHAGLAAQMPGMTLRAMRRVLNSPGWNSAVANYKQFGSEGLDKLAQGGFGTGQAAAYLSSGGDEPVTPEATTVKPGATATIDRQATVKPQPDVDFIWDPKTQSFLPAKKK